MKLQLLLHCIFLLLSLCETKPIAKSNHTTKCGNRPLVDEYPRTSRIVGGVDAPPGNWPWVVSIQQSDGSTFNHRCVGTIINNTWVISAASCFKMDNKLEEWRIVIGTTQLSHLEPHTQIRNISVIFWYEKFDPNNPKNDISLVKVDKPILFDNFTQPACLPHQYSPISSLIDCYIAGWGRKKEGDKEQADILQEAKVEQIFTPLCNSTSWYNGIIHESNMCAGYEKGGIDSCKGDSGGPLMCKRLTDKNFYVVGMTSWGYGCGQKRRPGVYTPTQRFIKWIDEIIEENEEEEEVISGGASNIKSSNTLFIFIFLIFIFC